MQDWFFSLIEQFKELAASYQTLGMTLSVLITFCESFLPFLPLAAFVVANATAYGLGLGFLLSLIGTVLGSYCVFLLVRTYGKSRFLTFVTKHPSVEKAIHWVDAKGLTPIFILLCFPFTPSVIVNVVVGLSNIRKKYYFFTLIGAKSVMIFFMSWVGSDLKLLFSNPYRFGLVILLLLIMWWCGKKVEDYLNNKPR